MNTAFSRSAANRICINEYSWLRVEEGAVRAEEGEGVELTFLTVLCEDAVGSTGLENVLRGITGYISSGWGI